MDADDEPAMAYFLPNGIADDSPPKKSRMKASFGPIGGRSAASSPSQSTDLSSSSTTAVSAASGVSNSRSDVDFSGLHMRPRPTLDPSPFGASGASSSSPRATNFLLSDLGGEIHTPRASRDFGDSGGRSSSPFGFPGAFGPSLSDGGTIGGAGAIRSPSSMFDRGQEAAKSFTMQVESRRGMASTGSFGSDSKQLYGRGAANLSSYLSAGDADSPFRSGSMSTWPSSATEVSQPRRVLQRPPGLAGPPGLSEPNAMDGVQPRMRLGSGGADMVQQRTSGPQFGPFRPSTSSPMASGGASNRPFVGSDDEFRPSLLSSLRLSSGVFSDGADNRGVSNPELAELNTHSVKVGDVGGSHVRQAVDSSSTRWDNRKATTSRRIDIQASSNTPRSPKKARDGRRTSESRSNLRAKALEFSMEAIGSFTKGSPMRPIRSDRERKSPPSASAQEPPSSSFESNRYGNDTPKGKRRNQVSDKGSASLSSNAGGSDHRKRRPTNQSEESGHTLTLPPGLVSAASPAELASRETGKPRRREDTKSSSRGTSRRNSARGNDKGTSTTRRQVYREKQAKEIVKEVAPPEEHAPLDATPSTASNSPRGSQASSDSQKSDAKLHELQKNTRTAAASSPSSPAKADALPVIAKSSNVTAKGVTDADTDRATSSETKTDEAVGRGDGAKIPDSDDSTSLAAAASALPDTPAEDLAVSMECESSSSSNDPEFEKTAREESSDARRESAVDSPESDGNLSPVESSGSDVERTQPQAAADRQSSQSTKKQKRKTAAPVPPTADTSPSVLPAETKLPVPSESSQAAEKKQPVKEHRKEKVKKEKVDKKKTSRGKKEKRGSSLISRTADAVDESATEAQDKLLEALATSNTPLSARISEGLRKGGCSAASAGILAFRGTRRGCAWAAGRLNVKGLLGTTFSYLESVLAVVFSVVLLLSLHAASWFIRIHRVAFRAILTHRHIGFCFAFLYGFPFLVQYVFPWAPPWAPVCLWYAFLVQLFCTSGPTAMVTTFRIILPLVFLVEGISHHSFLLDLNGAELLLTSFIISALKTSNLYSPIFFLSLATQCLLAVFLGSELIVQWLQLALALYSLHVMAATEDEWTGIGEDEDDLSCHPVPLHHSIADYNRHPAPSSAVSIQKTNRLDRRALAYVRGRRLR